MITLITKIFLITYVAFPSTTKEDPFIFEKIFCITQIEKCEEKIETLREYIRYFREDMAIIKDCISRDTLIPVSTFEEYYIFQRGLLSVSVNLASLLEELNAELSKFILSPSDSGKIQRYKLKLDTLITSFLHSVVSFSSFFSDSLPKKLNTPTYYPIKILFFERKEIKRKWEKFEELFSLYIISVMDCKRYLKALKKTLEE